MQFNPRDRQPAFRIFFHVADCFVGVIIEHKLFFTGDREKSEHVTTGERSNESFLGIDVLRISEIGRRRSCGHGVAAVEAPGVIAWIFLINKFSAAALPSQSNFVFGHICGIPRASGTQAKRTCGGDSWRPGAFSCATLKMFGGTSLRCRWTRRSAPPSYLL